MSTIESIRPSGEHLGDDPIVQEAISTNLRPAEIRASSCLAEDAVLAQEIDGIPVQVAPFRNPFSSREEVLYVTKDHDLYHAARGSGAAKGGTPGAGWRTSLVSRGIDSVHPVVHPNGSVYAFSRFIVGDSGETSLAVGQLVGFNTETGVATWSKIDVDLPPQFNLVSKLFVHYLEDRFATPVVFAVATSQTLSTCAAAAIFGSWDNKVQPWESRYVYDVSYDLADGLFALGYDDSSLAWMRYYGLTSDGTLWQGNRHIQGDHVDVERDAGWSRGLGGFSGPTGFGAVGLDENDDLRAYSIYDDGTMTGAGDIMTIDLPGNYAKQGLWQDSSGLMHVYGVDQSTQLSVVHQTGWTSFTQGGHLACSPVWDKVTDSKGVVHAVVRPLVAEVGLYGLDAYPDTMPNQCIFAPGQGPESMQILTQQPGTSSWESEVVRPGFSFSDTITPYLAPRYKSLVTVHDLGGNPVPLCAVSVTADAPVDVEVAGTTYRLGPRQPVTITTDLTGTFVLKINAEGLVTPNVHLTVPGAASALTLQPAAELHGYLAGAATLPTSVAGLSAEDLTTAKTPSGHPLFPNVVAAASADDDWPPNADQVIGWVQAAFAVSAKTSLPEIMTSRLAQGQEVLGFTLQTHDRTRPALEVFTSHEELAEHRRRIGASDPTPSMQEWFGDVVEGVRAHVLSLAQVTVDIANGTLIGLVDLGLGMSKAVSGFWDDAVSAAHCVELMFSALGAAVADVISWLTWPLGLADVWWAKGCVEGLQSSLGTEIKAVLTSAKELGSKWLSSNADTAIEDAVKAAAEVFGSQYTGRFQRPCPDPDTAPGFYGSFPPMDAWAAHLEWFRELLERLLFSYGPTIPFDDSGNTFDDLLAKLADLPWDGFESALEGLRTDLLAVFDPTNPFTSSQILITACINALAELAHAGVAVAVAAYEVLIDFASAMVDVIDGWYSRNEIDIPVLTSVWEWIQTQAGVPQDKLEALTFGRAAMFMFVFPGTVGFKVLFGKRPFPDGQPTLDDLKPSDGSSGLPSLPLPAELGDSYSKSVPPEKWWVFVTLQYFCSQMMTADAAFDYKINQEALLKDAGIPFVEMTKTELVIWAALHETAYGIGDIPWLWGNQITTGETADKWGPTAMWAMSLIANTADVGCAARWGTFVNSFEKNLEAAHTYSLLAIGRQIISLLRYFQGPDRGYSYARWNCAINVTSFVSAIGWARYGLKKYPHSAWYLVTWVKQRLDVACDVFAGTTSVFQILFENLFWPRIDAAPFTQTYTVGDTVSILQSGYLGVEPYDWSAERPTVVPPGTTGGLPAWLEMTTEGSQVAFRGTAETEGVWVFDLWLSDDYGPAMRYLSGLNTITVVKK